MPKEKKKFIDEKDEKVTLFYYEIIGAIIIILSIVTLGKLGKIGEVFSKIFKVMFGDWFFIFVFIILFIGIYYLFIHEPFYYKHNRFIGVIFLSVMIIIFSHFSIHNYIENSISNDQLNGENTSYIGKTWSLYKSYINSSYNSSLGGGLIGALIFYIIFLLTGKIGIILIGLLLGVLSLSLIFNTPFLDIFKWGFNRIRGTGSLFKSFNNFFRYELGKNLNKNDFKLPLKIFNYNLFEEVFSKNNNIYEKNNEYILKIKDKISEILIINKIKYVKTNYVISKYISTINIYTLGIYDKDKIISIFESIKDEINEIIFYDNIIKIQFLNKIYSDVYVYDLICKLDKSKNMIPVGLDLDNNIVLLNSIEYENILLIGEDNEINSYIFSYITILYLLNKSNEFELYIYDSNKNNTNIYINYINVYESIYSFIEHIKKYIEERIEFLNECNVSNYNEYLNKFSYVKKKLKKSYIIINSIINDIDDYNEIEEDIIYLNQHAKKCGITFIYAVSNYKYINNVINSVFECKLIFKCSNELLFKFANEEEPAYNASKLIGNGDSLFYNKNKYIHLCTPIIQDYEIQNIKEIIK